MPSILLPSLSVTAANKFVDVRAHGAGEHTYLSIGQQTAWANDLNPPMPSHSVNSQQAVWANMIGAHQVVQTDISHVVPRIDWAVGTEYFVKDPTLDNPWAQETYVLTPAMNVYRVASKDVSGTTYANPPLSQTTPTGLGAGIDTADGYTWDFLYDLSGYDSTVLLNSIWMPVNYGSRLSVNQQASGDIDAIYTLEAKFVQIRVRLIDSDFPVGIEYRQLALIENPLLLATTNKATGTNQLVSTLEPNSGKLIYIENRSPIIRATGQVEDINILVEF